MSVFYQLLRVGLVLIAFLVSGQHGASATQRISVTDHGAVAGGGEDCTQAFQAALDAAGASGGDVVEVPRGTFRVDGTLEIPKNVCLDGVWRAPVRGEPPDKGGSVLLAFAGKGDADGTPFITMHENSVLKGISIFYPEQVKANPPVPYPWTIQGAGEDNITVLDVTLINPYQAVDLGTFANGRHLVWNLYGYPLLKGLYINQCYDVGRIENIHFWPFWDIDPQSPLWEFTTKNGIAFILGKTDGEMGLNLFSIFYSIGMHFIDGPIRDAEGKTTGYAAGSGMYTNCYMDVSPCAVRVDAAMENAGVSFVNGSFMGGVVVGPVNQGPVKFSACGFWATQELAAHAVLEGRGPVYFEGCHFSNWDRAGLGVPCIKANNRRLIVTGCDFLIDRDGHNVLRLGPRVRSAVVTSNTMPGGVLIENNAAPDADVQIAHNAAEPKVSFIDEWLVLGPFPNEAVEGAAPGAPSRAGYDQDFLTELGGESRALIEAGAKISFTSAAGRAHVATATELRANERHVLDLHEVYTARNCVAYAFTYLVSETGQDAYLDAGLNDGGKIFVNGEQVYARFTPSGMQCRPGMDVCRARLEAGLNPVLVKIEDGGGSRWEFCFEAYGKDGSALESRLSP